MIIIIIIKILSCLFLRKFKDTAYNESNNQSKYIYVG